jgi:phosphoserine phosphatase
LARAFANERGFALEDACFYSDSITDLPLLEAVGTPIIVNPDARLRRHAKRRGWRIERWR